MSLYSDFVLFISILISKSSNKSNNKILLTSTENKCNKKREENVKIAFQKKTRRKCDK